MSFCSVVAGCFADIPVSMWASMAPSLSFDMHQIAIDARVAIDNTGFASGSPFDFNALQQSAADAQGVVNSAAGLSASTFGIPSNHSQFDLINADLAALTANATSANSVVLASNDYGCAADAEAQTQVLLNLTNSVLDLTSDAQLNATFACGFYRTAIDGVISPSMRGAVRDATGAIGACLLLAGIFALVLVWAIIALQIEYGDVGIEPGCPSCCRCCCCYKPGPNAIAGRFVSPDQAKAAALSNSVSV